MDKFSSSDMEWSPRGMSNFNILIIVWYTLHYGTIDESHNHVLAPKIIIIVNIFSFNNFTGNCWINYIL